MSETTTVRDEAPAAQERTDAPRSVGGSRAFAVLLVLTGAAGLLAAWVITLDKFKLLEAQVAGKTFTPACSINPIISCGSVMQSKQAGVFGFPNPMLGMVAYGIGALCLWCTLAWIATLTMFWYVTGHNVRRGFLPASAGVKGFAEEFHGAGPLLHAGVIGMLIRPR